MGSGGREPLSGNERIPSPPTLFCSVVGTVTEADPVTDKQKLRFERRRVRLLRAMREDVTKLREIVRKSAVTKK